MAPTEWYYLDRTGQEFGPFDSTVMRRWYDEGAFRLAGDDLLVRLAEWHRHSPLAKLYAGNKAAYFVEAPPSDGGDPASSSREKSRSRSRSRRQREDAPPGGHPADNLPVMPYGEGRYPLHNGYGSAQGDGRNQYAEWHDAYASHYPPPHPDFRGHGDGREYWHPARDPYHSRPCYWGLQHGHSGAYGPHGPGPPPPGIPPNGYHGGYGPPPSVAYGGPPPAHPAHLAGHGYGAPPPHHMPNGYGPPPPGGGYDAAHSPHGHGPQGHGPPPMPTTHAGYPPAGYRPPHVPHYGHGYGTPPPPPQYDNGRGKGGGRRNRAGQEHMKLNKEIIKISEAVNKGEKTLHDFLAEVDAKLDHMNEVNLSTALHRVAKICRSKGQHAVDEVRRNPLFSKLQMSVRSALLQAVQWLDGGGGGQVPMGAACVCWAHATLRLPDSGLFAEVAFRCAPHLNMFKNLEVANLIWAFAKLGEKGQGPTDLFNAAAGEAMARPDDFTVVNLSTLAWAFATSRVRHKAFFRMVARRIVGSAAEAESQEIANTLWAFATAGVFEKRLFVRIGSEAAGKLDTFKAQESANAAWAFGRAKIQHPMFFEALDRHLRSRADAFGRLKAFEPQHLAMILVAAISLNPARGSSGDDRGDDEEEDDAVDADVGNGAEGADEDEDDAEGAGCRGSTPGGSGGGMDKSRGQALAIGLASILLPECLQKVQLFKPDEAARLRSACTRMALLEGDDPPSSVAEIPEFARASSLARQFAAATAHMDDRR